MHLDEVGPVLESLAFDLPGNGSQPGNGNGVVEPMFALRAWSTRGSPSGGHHVPKLQALHPEEPRPGDKPLCDGPLPVVLDEPGLSP